MAFGHLPWPAKPAGLGGELRLVVCTDVIRNPAHQHDIGQSFNYCPGPDAELHSNRQGFLGVFVDNTQQPHRPTTMRSSGHEFIAPDVVRALRAQLDTAAVVHAQPAPGGLLVRHLQCLPAPDAFNLVAAQPRPAAIDHHRAPAVAMAVILAGKADDALGQRVLIQPADGPIALCVPRLAQDTRGMTLWDAIALNGPYHRTIASRGLVVSLGGILRNGFLYRQICHDAFEPLGLPLQLLQPLGPINLNAPILPPPSVVSLVRGRSLAASCENVLTLTTA